MRATGNFTVPCATGKLAVPCDTGNCVGRRPIPHGAQETYRVCECGRAR
jgi:hypothetical protein